MTDFLFHFGSYYIRIWDIIDVLIVAYIIYRALQLMRGTLAFQILLGLSVLFLVFKGAQVYQLATLHNLLRQFWQSWVILLIVLFQPEVRRVLAQVGRQWSWRSLYPADPYPVIHAVANAVETMVSQKTGALIVWERKTGLANFKEMGIRLDATVSSDLLLSIFNSKSPLHDGAVIITGNRLAAAGCFLPLSRNPQLTRAMGTRHRAAIGLTEDTDAVAIVVSEENGMISVAQDGDIKRMRDAEALKQYLVPLVANSKKQHERMPT